MRKERLQTCDYDCLSCPHYMLDCEEFEMEVAYDNEIDDE